MIRTLNFCLTLLALFLTTFCMAQKSELKFNKDGKFKIVQLPMYILNMAIRPRM